MPVQLCDGSSLISEPRVTLKNFREQRVWLRYLVEQPLCKHYGINVDWSVVNDSRMDTTENEQEDIEVLNVEFASEIEMSTTRQQTMVWK